MNCPTKEENKTRETTVSTDFNEILREGLKQQDNLLPDKIVEGVSSKGEEDKCNRTTTIQDKERNRISLNLQNLVNLFNEIHTC